MRTKIMLASALAVASLAGAFGPALGGAGAALAQSQLQGPAELPPASYRAMQYIDSRGCAFVRAGPAGSPVWVPRVTRERQQICGQPPSLANGGRVVAPTVPPASAPPPAAPAVATAAVEPPARPAAGAPIQTVASLTSAPQLPASVGAAPPAFPSPAPVAAAAPAPAPRPITLAEACQGRSGPLTGYVNAATGQPVSCGPAPVAIAMAPVAETVAPQAAPAAIPVAAPAPRGITLEEACRGRPGGPLTGYVSAATGAAVSCPGAPATALPPPTYAAAVAAPPPVTVPAPVVASAPCPPGVLGGVAYRCGGGQGALTLAVSQPAQEASHARAAQAAPLQAAPVQAAAPRHSYLIDLDGPVPASNPQGVSPVAGPPAGYVAVFEDGRHNTRRGPQGGAVVGAIAHEVAYQPVPQTIAVAPAPVVAAPAPQVAAGHRFVQVGSFGQSANASRAAANLRALGLPVSVTTTARGLQSVAAGPFADAATLAAALRAARAAGYSDAYAR